MNCLDYEVSTGAAARVGDILDVDFHGECNLSPLDWNSMLARNDHHAKQLNQTGVWSYDILGQVVNIDLADSSICVDCGSIILRLSWASPHPDYVGAFIGFDVSRLTVWRA